MVLAIREQERALIGAQSSGMSAAPVGQAASSRNNGVTKRDSLRALRAGPPLLFHPRLPGPKGRMSRTPLGWAPVASTRLPNGGRREDSIKQSLHLDCHNVS